MANATAEDEASWVSSFVEDSDKARDPYKDIWQETFQNYLVRPWAEGQFGSAVQYPYLTGQGPDLRAASGYAVLKDPESHQITEALVSSALQLIFSSPDFMLAHPVGREDTWKGSVATRLLRYVFRLEGH